MSEILRRLEAKEAALTGKTAEPTNAAPEQPATGKPQRCPTVEEAREQNRLEVEKAGREWRRTHFGGQGEGEWPGT